jgi:hypothetical protein
MIRNKMMESCARSSQTYALLQWNWMIYATGSTGATVAGGPSLDDNATTATVVSTGVGTSIVDSAAVAVTVVTVAGERGSEGGAAFVSLVSSVLFV